MHRQKNLWAISSSEKFLCDRPWQKSEVGIPKDRLHRLYDKRVDLRHGVEQNGVLPAIICEVFEGGVHGRFR